jgi:hypothetical protein
MGDGDETWKGKTGASDDAEGSVSGVVVER